MELVPIDGVTLAHPSYDYHLVCIQMSTVTSANRLAPNLGITLGELRVHMEAGSNQSIVMKGHGSSG